MALEKNWNEQHRGDMPAPTTLYHPQCIPPIHVAHLDGKRHSGEAFKDGVVSLVCSEKDELENL
jgi:hypothetical protein